MSTASAVTPDCIEALRTLKGLGFDFFTGVADSTLASLIRELERDPAGYVPAAREDLAVGMASGAFMAGRWPCVLMQNSGIGYCLNALTSLSLIYKIPALLLVGYRGYQGKDAPEHLVMGRHCKDLLEQIGVAVLDPAPGDLSAAITQASNLMRQKQLPVAVMVRPGVLSA